MKGRGAQHNPHNRFFGHRYETGDEQRMPWEESDLEKPVKTKFVEVFPKSILSENDSPDLGFRYGLNPYQGCEHGCVYCYARNSHEYWGYSAGREFEEIILYKPQAAQILRESFRKPGYQPDMVMFSGNTDCYQPAERTFGITRELLKVFLEHRHPVGLITKNALILRDLDVLVELNKLGLLRVTLSITTLNEELRRKMEPRTSSVKQRLNAVEKLTEVGVPVNVNMAPIVMGLNSEEVFAVAKAAGERGAYQLSYIMARLNGQIAEIFETWIRSAYPERAEKVLNQIRATHSGKLNESEWGKRMKGSGNYADQIARMVQIARKKFIRTPAPPPVRFDLFRRNPGQPGLFDE